MSLIPVITRAKFDTLGDDLKALYKPVGDTFQLDIDESSLAEHIAVKDKNVPLLTELEELRQKNTSIQSQLEQHQDTVNNYKEQTNKRIVDDTVNELTNNLDLSDGRNELLNRLLEPKINSLLAQAQQDVVELDKKEITREINSELTKLKRISSSIFIEKKDDGGGIRYEKQKGTITNGGAGKNTESTEVNYDNYQGSISAIDYDDYMKNYFNKED